MIFNFCSLQSGAKLVKHSEFPPPPPHSMLVSVAIELCVDRALLYKPKSNTEEGERGVLTLKYEIAWVFHFVLSPIVRRMPSTKIFVDI